MERPNLIEGSSNEKKKIEDEQYFLISCTNIFNSFFQTMNYKGTILSVFRFEFVKTFVTGLNFYIGNYIIGL